MSTVKAANLQNTGSGAPVFKNSSGTEIGQLVKAWVNFDGTGTVSITDDFNVSSITDVNTGRFQINMTNALSNANYVVGGSAGMNGDGYEAILVFNDDTGADGMTPTTSAFRIRTAQGNNLTSVDKDYVAVMVIGD